MLHAGQDDRDKDAKEAIPLEVDVVRMGSKVIGTLFTLITRLCIIIWFVVFQHTIGSLAHAQRAGEVGAHVPISGSVAR